MLSVAVGPVWLQRAGEEEQGARVMCEGLYFPGISSVDKYHLVPISKKLEFSEEGESINWWF